MRGLMPPINPPVPFGAIFGLTIAIQLTALSPTWLISRCVHSQVAFWSNGNELEWPPKIRMHSRIFFSDIRSTIIARTTKRRAAAILTHSLRAMTRACVPASRPCGQASRAQLADRTSFGAPGKPRRHLASVPPPTSMLGWPIHSWLSYRPLRDSRSLPFMRACAPPDTDRPCAADRGAGDKCAAST